LPLPKENCTLFNPHSLEGKTIYLIIQSFI
jgi:hypothetical protein